MIINQTVSGGGSVAEPKIMMYTVAFADKTSLYRGNQVDLNGADDIGDYALKHACENGLSPTTTQYALIGTQNLTMISGYEALSHAFDGAKILVYTGLGAITSVTGYHALYYAFTASSIQTADLGSLETAELKSSTSGGTTAYSPLEYTFNNCTSLTSADLSSFKYFVYNDSGATSFAGFTYTFSNCSALVSVDLSSFEKFVGGDFNYTFQNCVALTTITYDQAKIANLFSTSAVRDKSFYYTFSGCSALTVPYFIKEASGVVSFGNNTFYQMFNNCTSLASTGLSNVEVIIATYAFTFSKTYAGCTALTSTGLDNVRCMRCGDTSTSTNAAFTYMFNGCTGLTTTGLNKLTFAKGKYIFCYMFSGCTGLTNETFTNLGAVYGDSAFYNMFRNCTSLVSLSFPQLIASTLYGTSTFANMLYGCSGVTVHFPSNAQAVIGSWASVTGGFGGTNTTVLFDLPATYYIQDSNSNNLFRMPTEDTANSLAWFNYESSDYGIVYTSGTSQPSVGDTIYTDSACTVASGSTVSQII